MLTGKAGEKITHEAQFRAGFSSQEKKKSRFLIVSRLMSERSEVHRSAFALNARNKNVTRNVEITVIIVCETAKGAHYMLGGKGRTTQQGLATNRGVPVPHKG